MKANLGTVLVNTKIKENKFAMLSAINLYLEEIDYGKEPGHSVIIKNFTYKEKEVKVEFELVDNVLFQEEDNKHSITFKEKS